ncbi:TIGR00282 family metallophosphoesterase [Candidatus Odyssella thessalonicensis]|uniref:TIGR00282 family metallophosphoesterase n=1 Tax=Candidatus Odyssella thessalonicensis TaxID=84647 RepID=UPI000225A8EF|nr:TIGR00282 family metallophosphoesterase [Candidatus Odyssella thessalonicensis]
MNILFCGDVVGRSGRDILLQQLPRLKAELSLDFIIVNGENAAHGFGINKAICQDFFKAGIDVVTTGNHIWDQREVMSYIGSEPRLLRPANYPDGAPGRGHALYQDQRGRKVLVINVMGRLFMESLDDPFKVVDHILKPYPLGSAVQAIFIDIHAEATSEKMALGHFCDGRVSCVVGTHSHIPTADAQILPKGTAYQTDAGMCGDYNSVIGMDKVVPVHRFTRKTPTERMIPALGDGTVCGVFVQTDDHTGLALRIEPVRIGARLINTIPCLGEELPVGTAEGTS